jgi:hypothetical protein
MLDKLDEALDERIKALGEIDRDKLRVARAYNKKSRKKHFRLETFFKMILPIKSKSNMFGKWLQIGKGRIESRK